MGEKRKPAQPWMGLEQALLVLRGVVIEGDGKESTAETEGHPCGVAGYG